MFMRGLRVITCKTWLSCVSLFVMSAVLDLSRCLKIPFKTLGQYPGKGHKSIVDFPSSGPGLYTENFRSVQFCFGFYDVECYVR